MTRRKNQNGFIPMIITLVVIIVAAIVLVYMRVQNAQK
jgi:hypothetical protein